MPQFTIPDPSDDELDAAHDRMIRRAAADLERRLGRRPTAIEVGNDCSLYFWEISEALPDLLIPGAYQHPQIRGAVWAKSNGRCWYCGWPMNPFITFTVDHLRPQAAGGKDNLTNLVPCCRECNAIKGVRSLSEFRRAFFYGEARLFWFEREGREP